MTQYPLKNVNYEEWTKKIQSASMFTIVSEEQALPFLHELNEILARLLIMPAQETLSPELIQYFLTNVIPSVCDKLIRSRYLKIPEVLEFSNNILSQATYLVPKFIDFGLKHPKFLQILITVFNEEEDYFKNNNQLLQKPYPFYYFDLKNSFGNQLKEGDFVDVLKTGSFYDKMSWSRGKVVEKEEGEVQIAFLNDYYDKTIILSTDSIQIAPFKSKTLNYEWRENLKVGDLVDCEDNYGRWFNCTVIKVIEKRDNKRQIKISMKVYHPEGKKQDEDGKFFGFSDHEETLDYTSPKLQPYCSMAKEHQYHYNRHTTSDIDDSNDEELQYINNLKIYAFPRKKHLSEFLFKTINEFGQMKGFDIFIQLLEKQINFDILSYFTKTVGGIASYLHKKVVKELTKKIKYFIDEVMFNENEKLSKEYTKQKSQMIFTGLKALQERTLSKDDVSEYENSIRMKIVGICLQSQSLKKKLQGLGELKQIIQNNAYNSKRNREIKKWIQEMKFFDKIYLVNSHVQLIKKSEEFFKFLLDEEALQTPDLQKLYKIAQKGDYESRISLFKLFKEVSHIFNKEQVQFLINAILQSDLQVVLKEDIDFLHELSRYSNYFPLEKVVNFFESIIFSDNKVKELTQYATKKYSQMIARAHQMRSHRRQIIKRFLNRMNTHDICQVTKVLKGIFSNINFSEYGKKDCKQIITEEKVDQVIIKSINLHKTQSDFYTFVTEVLGFLLYLYKLSQKIKIYVKTLRKIWDQIKDHQEIEAFFYAWANDILKCDQGISSDGENKEEFQDFFKELFPVQKLDCVNENQFKLAKNLFIELNSKSKFLSVSNILREKQILKQCKRKVPLKDLKMFNIIMRIIFSNSSQNIINKALSFFQQVYNSKENNEEQIFELYENFIQKLFQYQKEQNQKLIFIILKLLLILIDDSEKKKQANISSLLSQKRGPSAKFIIINETSYTSDNIKKIVMNLGLNTTLLQMRKIFSSEFDCPWPQIRIVGHRELEDYENSLSLKKLKLDPRCPLTISRKIEWSEEEEEILINNKFNPKAIRCFRKIFEKYAENQVMTREQCFSFTQVCLGSHSSIRFYNQKIDSLYNKYNISHDNLLKFEEFLEFYEDATREKASTVWSNLRSFGVKGNFRFIGEPDENEELKQFPRSKLSKNQQIYQILFCLLQKQVLGPLSFQILERLQVYKVVEEQILNSLDFESVLSVANPYMLLYKLSVMEFLLFPKQQISETESKWAQAFYRNQGFQNIFTILKQLIQAKQINYLKREVYLNILNISLRMLMKFWRSTFVEEENEKFCESNALLSLQYDVNEKIQYLTTGYFYDKEQKIQINQDLYYYDKKWEGDNPLDIGELLVSFFFRFYERTFLSNNQSNFELQLLFENLILSFNTLYFHRDPQNFAKKLSELLLNIKQTKIISKVYSLILCLCFFSNSDGKHQSLYIKELFKNLTKKNITAELFRVLAVLVSKFGISGTLENENEDNMEGDQQKMRQILVQNILSNENELTIEGCSKLLCNFPLSNMPVQIFNKIWRERIFNPETTCKKEQTKDILYELILKVSAENPTHTDHIIDTVCKTIEQEIGNIKITYSNEFKQKSKFGYAGLKNLGNICYINSMVQQLFMNKTFRYLLLRVDDLKQPEYIEVLDKEKVRSVDDNFLHQIQKIFAFLQQTNRNDFVPSDFCVAYKPFGESINVMVQQDVQEFIGMFFDRLENGISKTPLKNIVDNIYSGTNVNLFKCHDCLKTKKVEEKFFSLSLEVKNSKSLSQSFDRYILGQVITDYKCDFCEKKVDVSKKTRISKIPKTLIIHLQRIVFNLETFINQKISSKHSFPQNFNLHPYTLDYYERTQNGENQIKSQSMYDYNLIGIVCHTGNAESGHYISYIKTENNRWLQFNDSIISIFNPKNIESECFGGVFSVYDDEFDWDKNENSKSAYILLYERPGSNNIELILNNLEEKEKVLRELDLKQVIKKLKKENELIQKVQNQSVQQSQSQKKCESEMEQNTTGKKKQHKVDSQMSEKQNIMIQVEDSLSPYIPLPYQKQVKQDNRIHFFEKNLSTPSFSDFFSKLLLHQNTKQEQLLPICQKLTFGLWLKSPSFKNLLSTLTQMINYSPKTFINILKSPIMVNLLIQSSDSQIRTHMSSFLSKIIQDIVEREKLSLSEDNESESNREILKFLDNLFVLLPTIVSKCWTKFSQYFEFWYDLSKGSEPIVLYMYKKQIVKHFMDYFLDQKSPLKIYASKKEHEIGSSYANPNFSMLLKCVSCLLEEINKRELVLSSDEEDLLMSCESLQKLINDNYETIAANLVKKICPKNLYCSEKVAIVLLKGICKADYESIQTYLDVIHEFLLIKDEYQMLRIKWILGKQTLSLSTRSKKITAINSYTYDERIYNFESPLNIDGGSSLLQKLFVYYKKLQNYSVLSLKQILTLSIEDETILNYIYQLSSPVLTLSAYHDFFPKLIDKYLNESHTVYNYYSRGFNKQQLGKQVKELHEKTKAIYLTTQQLQEQEQQQLLKQEKEEEKKEEKFEKGDKNIQQDNEYAIQYMEQSEFQNLSSDEEETYLSKKYKNQNYPETWHPIQFLFQPQENQNQSGVIIQKHQSSVVYAKTKPTGYSNKAFNPGIHAEKIGERIIPQVLENKRTQKVKGFYITNKMHRPIRIKTEEGCEYCKGNSSIWVWSEQIIEIWEAEREIDWPHWTLFPKNQN